MNSLPLTFTSTHPGIMRTARVLRLPTAPAFCLAVAALAGAPRAAGAQTVVQGAVRWAPTSTTWQPVRLAAVQLLDADRGTLLDTARTDRTGAYRVTLRSAAVRNVRVVVHAASPYATVVHPATGHPHAVGSGPVRVPASGAPLQLPDLRPAPDDTANQALSVMGAIEHGAAFRARRMGPAPPPVEVVFPADARVSSFDGTRIFIRAVNARDWDVVLHEYGHYVARLDAMASAAKGKHYLDQSIGGEKKLAVALAWSEGWATWFSIAAQQEAGLAKLGIPHVGDAVYRDSGLKKKYRAVSLAESNPPWSFGERSEVAVMRVLFDLADEDGGKQGETVAMGNDRLWKALRKAQPEFLWPAWKAVEAALAPTERAAAAFILEAQSAAPVLLQPEAGARLQGGQPTFNWIGTESAQSVITVRDGAGTVLYRRDGITGTSHIPPGAEWAASMAGARGTTVFWEVQEHELEAPATGPYPVTPRPLVP